MQRRIFLLLLGVALVAAIPSISHSAEPTSDKDSTNKFTWQQTDTSLALLNQGRVVWSHVHDAKVGKPFMRFGLLDGTELTRPWPVPAGYPKADHTWHRALWWSWKTIDGVNFWEQHQLGTEPVAVQVETDEDSSAQITLTIQYHQPDLPPVVNETRVITVSSPDDSGAYFIDWKATFVSATGQPVEFGRNSYGGLAIRFSAECCGDSAAKRPAWEFQDSHAKSSTNGQQARWVAYSGPLSGEKTATVAILDHPKNPGHPAYWQLRGQYPYLNPSLTCKEPYRLAADEELVLQYRILVQPSPLDANSIEKVWQAFATQGE